MICDPEKYRMFWKPVKVCVEGEGHVTQFEGNTEIEQQ